MKKIFLTILLIMTAFFTTENACALVLGPDVLGFDFRFNNPGARANGMGGAFIGLADDASAAYTNPAGLTILTEPEISVEYKYGTATSRVKDGSGEHDHDSNGGNLSFVSYANPKEKATITLFKHKMIDTSSSTYFKDDPTDTGTYSEVEVNADTYGLGLGIKVAPTLSLGGAINFSQMNYITVATRIDSGTGLIDNHDRVHGSDSYEHVIASLLWNVFGEFNLGAVYHEGAEFTFERTRFTQDPTIAPLNPDLLYIEKVYEHVLYVPEFYGVGISYSMPFGLTMAADANHIKYSQILNNAIDDLGNTVIDLEIDDSWEYHAGLEYVVDLASTPVPYDAGTFSAPAIQ